MQLQVGFTLCALRYANSGRSDFLAHKDEVTDPEAEKGDGHDRYQMGKHNQETLEEWERILETA